MSKYHVKQSDVTPYSPANHDGTRNFRMISPETVGAKQLEVLVGEVEKGKGAFPHAHPGIEQACYMLEGRADIEIGGEKARILVIYAPPYLEKPENARR
jgi:quercetin dioxygenase-like cupin family protein